MFVNVSSVEKILSSTSLWLVISIKLLNSVIEEIVTRLVEESQEFSRKVIEIAAASALIYFMLLTTIRWTLLW